MNTQWSIAVYRHLTALYPKAFRAEYGADLVATFAEQLAEDGTAKTWLSTIRDVAVTVPSQHLEARMRRPNPQTLAVIATTVTVAALVLAFAAGTGPVVGVFLFVAIAALAVSTVAWKAARPAAQRVRYRWRTYLVGGVLLLGAVIATINVPPYNDRELPGIGWALMMLSLITSIGLITVGTTMGIAQRSTRHPRTH